MANQLVLDIDSFDKSDLEILKEQTQLEITLLLAEKNRSDHVHFFKAFYKIVLQRSQISLKRTFWSHQKSKVLIRW